VLVSTDGERSEVADLHIARSPSVSRSAAFPYFKRTGHDAGLLVLARHSNYVGDTHPTIGEMQGVSTRLCCWCLMPIRRFVLISPECNFPDRGDAICLRLFFTWSVSECQQRSDWVAQNNVFSRLPHNVLIFQYSDIGHIARRAEPSSILLAVREVY